MDLRRGEDEEMGWEREVGAAAPWSPEMMLADGRREGWRRREHRERERERQMKMGGRRNKFIYIF